MVGNTIWKMEIAAHEKVCIGGINVLMDNISDANQPVLSTVDSSQPQSSAVDGNVASSSVTMQQQNSALASKESDQLSISAPTGESIDSIDDLVE